MRIRKLSTHLVFNISQASALLFLLFWAYEAVEWPGLLITCEPKELAYTHTLTHRPYIHTQRHTLRCDGTSDQTDECNGGRQVRTM